MYAIVEIAGQQFKVEKSQQLFVHRLESKEGAKVTFDNVLLIENKGKVKVGAPKVNGAKVTAKVIEHLKGDKVIVFKFKKKTGYKKKQGHRQQLTRVLIEKISNSGSNVSKKTETETKTETKTEKTNIETKTEAKTEKPKSKPKTPVARR